jgi:hypothetical protein
MDEFALPQIYGGNKKMKIDSRSLSSKYFAADGNENKNFRKSSLKTIDKGGNSDYRFNYFNTKTA